MDQDKDGEKPALTLSTLAGTVGLVLRDLRLGPRSFNRSSAYYDYVALTFYIGSPTEQEIAALTHHFEVLCARHGWIAPKINVLRKSNEIMVTLQQANTITTDGNKRMPL